MKRVFNFNPGPAMLPDEVLLQAQAEMPDWRGTGMSVMEIGHRTAEFQGVAEQAEADLRELLSIPKNYRVLFLAGGASTQFAMVPLNLMGRSKKADYMDTGIWSKKAIDEARRYGEIHIAAKTDISHSLIRIQSPDEWSLNPDAAYLHYTANETIEGIEFHAIPDAGHVPLVSDMTSCILSRPLDVSRFGVIYAGAQKNLGQAGITVVIVRDDLIQEPLPGTPTLYSYKVAADNHSFYNTPPTYAWYIMGLVLAWMKRQGGVEAFAKLNQKKAEKLYRFIDEHNEFYTNNVDPGCRSIMNVPFSLTKAELTEQFLTTAAAAGLTNLKGHRLAGGVRASIYNAMPETGVDALIEFMRDFSKKHY
ncbi:MAG TPA: 3-phosphoserine/phosphohydroxythreonine transaminase [Gammaproteobacteria bacterium]|nr:3-phosphoserine/phosphohydroxythreonine transaminase [Gammaproteobacteria bacterium]